MKEKIVLHLGIHKTATTSLQDFLWDNRNELRKKGASFTSLDKTRANISPLIRSHKVPDREILQGLIEKSGTDVDILSDENLMGLTGDIKTGKLYPYAGGRVRRLCEQFDTRQIEVLLCVRSPVKFFLSSYSEYIRHYEFERFDSYIENYELEDFSYAELLSWTTELPDNANVTIIPFEEEHGGGIPKMTEAMLSLACGPDHGISTDSFPKTKSRSSFSVEEIEMGAKITRDANAKVALQFLRMIGFKDLRFGDTPFNPLSNTLMKRLEARYKEDLKTLL